MVDARKARFVSLEEPQALSCSEIVMKDKFKIGDHVSWNSEAGSAAQSFAFIRAISRSTATRTM
jgi:hypothetical protein